MPEIPRPSRRFAANLLRLREAAGLSQEELAFRAAIHRTQVSLFENGHRMPRVNTLICLAGGLGVTPDDLLDGITWEPIVAITGGLFVTPPEGGTMADGAMKLVVAERFGENLRRLRQAAGLDQGELAFRADIHRTQISYIESGRRMPRLDTLIKLACSLGVTTDDLVAGIDWEPSEQMTGGFAVTPRDGEGDG